MSQASLFTTHDGDIVLRAGTEPDSKHDFRVHKFILSLASPVFKDMFTLPQPSDQTLNEHQLLVVDVSDPPEVLDVIIRLIYPGVEPPKITEQKTLSASLLTADKYSITSIYPTLRENLKTFLPNHSLWVYIIACRFGFLEEKKQAAKLTSSESFGGLEKYTREAVQLISSTDLFRLFEFVKLRESEGRVRIGWYLHPISAWRTRLVASTQGGRLNITIPNWRKRSGMLSFSIRVSDPTICLRSLIVYTTPPPGCDSLPRSGDWYSVKDEDAFKCPLQPMTTRKKLVDLADVLRRYNEELLQRFFGGV